MRHTVFRALQKVSTLQRRGYTFSIYLFHRPLQHLASQYYQYRPGDEVTALLLGVFILLVIIAFGAVTERRTAAWRRVIVTMVRR